MVTGVNTRVRYSSKVSMHSAYDRRLRPLPGWVSGVVSIGVFGVLLWMELRRPLRKAVEPKLRRNARNLAVAGLAALSLRIAEQPVVGPLSRIICRRRWGLLPWLALPLWLEVAAAV